MLRGMVISANASTRANQRLLSLISAIYRKERYEHRLRKQTLISANANHSYISMIGIATNANLLIARNVHHQC